MIAVLLSLSLACSTTPERIDGKPYDESHYKLDEDFCRAQVRGSYPNLRRQMGTGRAPANAVSFASMDYQSCMTERGWR